MGCGSQGLKSSGLSHTPSGGPSALVTFTSKPRRVEVPTTSLKGASALVSMFTFISRQPWVGVFSFSGFQKRSMHTVPGLMPSVTRAMAWVLPRWDATQTQSPSATPHCPAAVGWIHSSGAG